MKQRVHLHRLVSGLLLALTLASVATLLCVWAGFSLGSAVDAQVRSKQRLPRTQQTPTTGRTQTRASRFIHEHHRLPRTKLGCSDCHAIPSREAPDEIAAATKPTIKGYPYHDSCLECHRKTSPHFFRGSTPTICTTCHTRSSPRLSARDMNRFPGKNEPQMELEFPGFFPHDQRDHKRVNCATCHTTDARAYSPISVGSTEAPYKPLEGTFKTSPFGHAACFKCHWEEKPTKDDCAGCHLIPDAIAKKKQDLITPSLMDWFKSWPLEWPKRISIKFNHDSKSHNDECITCHDIAKLQTLDIPRPDVPMAPCAKCHLKPGTPGNIATEMFEEDEDIAEGRNNNPTSREGKHTCRGCHSGMIGSMPPPCSHYLLFDDTYLKPEDYPKSARKIAERCKR